MGTVGVIDLVKEEEEEVTEWNAWLEYTVNLVGASLVVGM